MRFHATDVNATASGDYYQLLLGPEETAEAEADPYEVRGPYLLVQRQFEMFDHGERYIETLDERYIGHFKLRLAELTRTRLAFDIARNANNHVEVSIALNTAEFEELKRIAEMIFGLRVLSPTEN
jgi:hypothetical protein